jgi:hypothetical protein
MAEVSVEIGLGEGSRAASPAHLRLSGGAKRVLAPAMAGLIVGFVAAPMLGSIAAWLIARFAGGAAFERIAGTYWNAVTLLQIVGAVVGWEMGEKLGLAQGFRRFLAAVAERGAPAAFPTRFRLADDGFHIDNGRLAHVAAWAAVLEVFEGPQHWLVQIDTVTVALPKRAFATREAERAFLRELASRMTPGARARSRELMAAVEAAKPQ